MTTMFVDPVTKRYSKEPVISVDGAASIKQVEMVHLCNRCIKDEENKKMMEGTASGKQYCF